MAEKVKEVYRYHRRVSMPGLPIVLYNTFTLRPIIILYSGCIVFLSGIMFRRHARPPTRSVTLSFSPCSPLNFREPFLSSSLSRFLRVSQALPHSRDLLLCSFPLVFFLSFFYFNNNSLAIRIVTEGETRGGGKAV